MAEWVNSILAAKLMSKPAATDIFAKCSQELHRDSLVEASIV